MRTRLVALVGALVLVAAGCSGDDAAPTTTTTSVAPTSSTTSTTAVPVTTTSTTTTIPTGPAIAQEGDDNETVEAIQVALNCAGFGDLTIDGDFGPATLAAVNAAQEALGRSVGNAVDEETFAQLSRTCADAREILVDDAPLTLVGNAATGDPERFDFTLASKGTVTIEFTAGTDLTATLSKSDGTLILPAEGALTTWEIEEAGDYRLQIEPLLDPTTFAFDFDVLSGAELAGQWILATDGITYEETELGIGDDADEVIDNLFDFLGHGVRDAYEEFDTDWYVITDPQSLGLRGIYIEGMAFLFFGPHPEDTDRPETLARIRFDGASDDAEGNPRPDNYVTTALGITVGDTLADLKAAYGTSVKSGSNSEEHYYRLTDSGGELCFYFGASEPTDSSVIVEMATECRS